MLDWLLPLNNEGKRKRRMRRSVRTSLRVSLVFFPPVRYRIFWFFKIQKKKQNWWEHVRPHCKPVLVFTFRLSLKLIKQGKDSRRAFTALFPPFRGLFILKIGDDVWSLRPFRSLQWLPLPLADSGVICGLWFAKRSYYSKRSAKWRSRFGDLETAAQQVSQTVAV